MCVLVNYLCTTMIVLAAVSATAIAVRHVLWPLVLDIARSETRIINDEGLEIVANFKVPVEKEKGNASLPMKFTQVSSEVLGKKILDTHEYRRVNRLIFSI